MSEMTCRLHSAASILDFVLGVTQLLPQLRDDFTQLLQTYQVNLSHGPTCAQMKWHMQVMQCSSYLGFCAGGYSTMALLKDDFVQKLQSL